MGIFVAGVEYTGIHVAGVEISELLADGEEYHDSALAPVTSYSIRRTLDRTFSSDTPASGGGDVTPDTFARNGATWQLWQVVPYLGVGVAPPTRGDARIHIRDTSVSRNQNLLANMPTRIVLSKGAGDSADWVGLPWTFTRPGSSQTSKFTSPGSGDAARRGIDYEPSGRTPLANAGASGIAQGETFTITLHFD